VGGSIVALRIALELGLAFAGQDRASPSEELLRGTLVWEVEAVRATSWSWAAGRWLRPSP
jgi:hypothetical protein